MPIAASANQNRDNGGIMGMIVDRSLTAARGLAKVRRQRGKRLYDSVGL